MTRTSRHVAVWPGATDVVMQQNVGSWGKSRSGAHPLDMTRMTQLGSGVCIAAVQAMAPFDATAPQHSGRSAKLERHTKPKTPETDRQCFEFLCEHAGDGCFLTRSRMPVDNGEQSRRFQGVSDRTCQTRLIRHAVEGVGEKHEINRHRPEPRNVVRIARHEVAIAKLPFAQPMAGYFQQCWVYVDCDHTSGKLGDLQREPSVARA